MSFKEYHSIENHYRSKFIDYIKTLTELKDDWCATEKVHGSNVSFIINKIEEKIEIQKATRSQIIGKDGNFFKLSELMNQYSSNLTNLFEKIGKSETVIVYGEMYGGFYPGSKSKPVQKGVKYSPDIRFIAFDIRVGDSYMNYDKAIELFIECEIPYASILHRGTLDEMLKLNPVFVSTISAKLGLTDEKIDLSMNYAEGYVLKPVGLSVVAKATPFRPTSNEVEPLLVTKPDGDTNRIILKLKNPSFDEIVSHKEEVKEKDKDKNKIEISDEIKNFILSCVNQNRYESVTSKLLEADRTKGKIIPLFIKDVMTDVEKEYNDKSIKKNITSIVAKTVAEFVNKML